MPPGKQGCQDRLQDLVLTDDHLGLADLRRIGRQARTALNKDLKKGGTLELRRRIEALLEELKQREAGIRPEELREVRAVEVLETIGTPAARSLLKSLAGGGSGARLTDEAGFALERLEKRK
jgi:hypothetical protein